MLTNDTRYVPARQEALPYGIAHPHGRLLAGLVSQMRNLSDLTLALNKAMRDVRSTLGCDRALIYRFGKNWTGEVVCESLADGATTVLGTVGSDNCFPQQYAWLYRNGRVRTIEDVTAAGLDPCHAAFLLRCNVRANAVVPLFNGTVLWGLLIIHYSRPWSWPEEETALLRSVAEHLSLAVRQAHFITQVRRKTERERLLLDIATQLRSTLEIENILSTIALRCRAALGADRVVVYRLHESGGICCSESNDTAYPPMIHSEYGTDCLPEEYLEYYRSGGSKTVETPGRQSWPSVTWRCSKGTISAPSQPYRS